MRAAALQVGRWKSATALKSDARTCYYRRIGRHSRLRWTSASGLPSVSRRHAAAASEGWSGRRGSNPRPTAWKAVTLPLSYSRLRGPLLPLSRRYGGHARRVRQSHPVGDHALDTRGAREARLPPNQQRHQNRAAPLEPRGGLRGFGGQGRVRTSAARRRQVYSLLRLTALPPPRTSRARRPQAPASGSARVRATALSFEPHACVLHMSFGVR